MFKEHGVRLDPRPSITHQVGGILTIRNKVTYPESLPSGGSEFVAWYFGNYKPYKKKGASKSYLSQSQFKTELSKISSKYKVYTDPGYPDPKTPDYPAWPNPTDPTLGGTWTSLCSAAGVSPTSHTYLCRRPST